MADGKPIIVIKKKGGHGGHHGGAWKIAYADFVTAMMAFFMVMWLVNTADVVTKENIASYFRRPGIFDAGSGTPLMMGQSGILEDAFTPSTQFKAGTQGGKNDTEEGGGKGDEAGKYSTLGGEDEPGLGEGEGGDKSSAIIEEKLGMGNAQEGDPTLLEIAASESQVQQFEQTAEEIKTMIAGSPELQDLLGVVDVKLEADGLNIEVIDTEKTSMFMVGSARIATEAEEAFAKLADIVVKLNNSIDIVGHTDSRPYAQQERGYSNWELSADRANAARRILQKRGFDTNRINSVIGMADRLHRKPNDPLDPTNRRISLKIRFNMPSTSELSADELQRKAEQLSKTNAQKDPFFATPTPAESQQQQDTKDPAHVFTPKEIIRAATRRNQNTVRLPKEREPNIPFIPSKKDKIFSDSPVLAPGDPFDF